jgi:hypothetical protein
MRGFFLVVLVISTSIGPGWSCPSPTSCLKLGCTADSLARSEVLVVAKFERVERPFRLMRAAQEWAFVVTGFRSILPEGSAPLRVTLGEARAVKGEPRLAEMLDLFVEPDPLRGGPSAPATDRWYLVGYRRSLGETRITDLEELKTDLGPDDIVRAVREDPCCWKHLPPLPVAGRGED